MKLSVIYEPVEPPKKEAVQPPGKEKNGVAVYSPKSKATVKKKKAGGQRQSDKLNAVYDEILSSLFSANSMQDIIVLQQIVEQALARFHHDHHLLHVYAEISRVMALWELEEEIIGMAMAAQDELIDYLEQLVQPVTPVPQIYPQELAARLNGFAASLKNSKE